jgi:hypothetical protein
VDVSGVGGEDLADSGQASRFSEADLLADEDDVNAAGQ